MTTIDLFRNTDAYAAFEAGQIIFVMRIMAERLRRLMEVV